MKRSRRKQRQMSDEQVEKFENMISDAYLKHKSVIDVAYEGIDGATPLEAFTIETMNIKQKTKNISYKQAIEKMLRKEAFLPEADRMKQNLLKGLRKQKGTPNEPGAYELWRKYTQHQKILSQNITYKGVSAEGDRVYQYLMPNGRFIIEIIIHQSPEKWSVRKFAV